MRGSETDDARLRFDVLGVPELGAPCCSEVLRGVTALRDQDPSDRTGARGEELPPQNEAPLGELVAFCPRPDSFCWYMLMPLHLHEAWSDQRRAAFMVYSASEMSSGQ